MRTWYKLIHEIIAGLGRLRPYLGGGRYLLGAVVVTTMISSFLDGIALGTLLPLLYLLQWDPNAKTGPPKPIRWLQHWFPNHDLSFYVILLCGLVLGTIALKNLVYFISQVLTARLRLRMGVNLREALFRRLHNADLAIFE